MFEPVQYVRTLMAAYPGDYWIAGGWAVDLFHGYVRREHADIEISVPHHDHLKLAPYFTGWTFRYAEDDVLYPWDGVTALSPDIHELHLTGPDGQALEVLLDRFDGDTWVYRRDPAMTLSRDQFPPRGDGFPIELVLLFKSKNPREKDKADFNDTLPLLMSAQRTWLKEALPTGHPWRKSL